MLSKMRRVISEAWIIRPTLPVSGGLSEIVGVVSSGLFFMAASYRYGSTEARGATNAPGFIILYLCQPVVNGGGCRESGDFWRAR